MFQWTIRFYKYNFTQNDKKPATCASTSNGIISVSSKIYCVKKGETLTIKVNWPSYEVTQCVGVDDYSVVDVTWENNNLAIKGINQGVTELSFSSDQSGTQDSFSVAIICY